MTFNIGDKVYCEWSDNCNETCSHARCSIATIVDGPTDDLVRLDGQLQKHPFWQIDILSTDGHPIYVAERRLRKIPPDEWEKLQQQEEKEIA
jgi:hypothetical protein